MPTPPTPPTAAPHDGDRRKSLGKYVKRVSSVFKREKSSKSVPQSSAAVGSEPEPEHVPVAGEVAAAQHVQEPIEQKEEPTEPVAGDLTPSTSIQPPAPITATPPQDRHAMQQERARALFAKYGLTLESHDWMAASAPAPLVPRVEKAIRMRVHRSCHRCGALYGHDKVCLQCEHKRCKKCPRYPKKKSPTDKTADTDAPDQPRKKKLLTLTTRSGNELAYKPATQRVHRTCHKCTTPFNPPTSTTCPQCHHTRCTACPRDPPKRNKWPTGYPGDVSPSSDSEPSPQQHDTFRRIWRKPRRIVRWECERCHAMFRQGSPLCPGCGHGRCDQCTRSPVKKQSREESFDPAVVAAVEAKLRALSVEDDPLTSEPEYS